MLLLALKSRLPSRATLGWFLVAIFGLLLLSLFAAENRVTFIGSVVLSLLVVLGGSRVLKQVTAQTIVMVLHTLGGLVALAGPITGELPAAFVIVGGLHFTAGMALWVWTEGRGAAVARLTSVVAAGAGLGMPMVAAHLGYLSPWAHAWTPIALLILWAWTFRVGSTWTTLESRMGALGIAGCAMLTVWVAITADPWRSRSSSDRFLVSYMTERVAAGEKFDQAAFLRAWDFEDDERPIIIGTGLNQVHLYCTPEGLPEKLGRIDALERAVSEGKIRLYLHPVPSQDYRASVAWTESILAQPQSWPAALRGTVNPPATTTFKSQAEAALRGSVRSMARLGVLAAPQLVGLASGKKPYPLDPVTFEDVSGSSPTAAQSSGLLEGKK